MSIFFRTVTYASLFIGLLLIYLPGRILESPRVGSPLASNWLQVAGFSISSLGALLALSCIVTFMTIGKGTPAPFDPPRRLVVRGPYRFVRNPMYIGVGIVLGGVALSYGSLGLLAYGCIFLLASHCLVVLYEEPTLRRTFGPDYDAYCRSVHRWQPRIPAAG